MSANEQPAPRLRRMPKQSEKSASKSLTRSRSSDKRSKYKDSNITEHQQNEIRIRLLQTPESSDEKAQRRQEKILIQLLKQVMC